jgi:sporulation protein YlmC with PRC-barrel domain
MADLELLYLSGLIGRPATGTAGETIGRLRDLVVHLSQEPFPPLTGLVLAVPGRRGHRFFVPAERLEGLAAEGARLNSSTVDLRPFARRPHEALLYRDVLDKQIIDINGRRVIRVNDQTLSRSEGRWRLAGADVSAGALLGRLAGRRRAGEPEREIVPWDAVQFFASEVAGGAVQR